MAEAKKAPAPAAEGEAPVPKKKGKLLILVGGAVLLLVVLVVGAMLLLKKPDHGEEEEEEEAPPPKEVKKKKDKKPDAPPVFTKLDPFVVRLQGEPGAESYVQLTPELRVLDLLLVERVKQFMPKIRNDLLLILAGKSAADLSTPAGVKRLSNEMREAINAIIDGPKKKRKGDPEEPPDEADEGDSVQEVLFTTFIIQ